MKMKAAALLFFTAIAVTACGQVMTHSVSQETNLKGIITGAELTKEYLPFFEGKNIAVVANQTSLVGNTHLVDSLLSLKVKVKTVFAPEHGFRGEAEAGEHIAGSTDAKTGVKIISLYGDKKKPSSKDLEGIDVVVFDIQDVGVRFYTYISTMQYVMEACAELNKAFIVLDRPNPNGYYVDGPVMEDAFKSFVGRTPIPIVHGLTVGEYATMLNGEQWLEGKLKCNLTVIRLKNYAHSVFYSLPIPPSPNLPNMSAVYLYPSLGLFEGTAVSVGRGTELPFQIIGFPGFQGGSYTFTPKSIPGKSVRPPHEGVECKGFMLKDFGEMFVRNSKSVYLFWLMGMYEKYPDKTKFFNSFFDKLAGTAQLKEQIMKGMSEEEIRKSWQPALDKYKSIRQKYLLYPDFE